MPGQRPPPGVLPISFTVEADIAKVDAKPNIRNKIGYGNLKWCFGQNV